MASEFLGTRRSVVAVSITVSVVALAALVVLGAVQASLWPWAYQAASNVLGVLFGLAVVSMLWEFFVRRDHGSDLRHYLRLGASVAKSGLQDVAPRSKLDWQRLLESANEVVVLTNSAEWLDRNVYLLLDVARNRPVAVTVVVPVKGGAYLTREARKTGKSSDALSDAIFESVTGAARLWREARSSGQSIHKSSKLSVLEHDFDLEYEVIMIDNTTVVTLTAPGSAGATLDRLAFVYTQNTAEYPTSYFASFRTELSTMNGLDGA